MPELSEHKKNYLYSIKGKGRGRYYKITDVDKVANEAYLTGMNCGDAGYTPIDRIRPLSKKLALQYYQKLNTIINDIKKRYGF